MEVVFRDPFGFLQPNELQPGWRYRGQLKTVAFRDQFGLYRQTTKNLESAEGAQNVLPRTNPVLKTLWLTYR